MEKVLGQIISVDDIEKKISKAHREGKISGKTLENLIASAVETNIITQDEAERFSSADQARMRVIDVDDFAPDEF